MMKRVETLCRQHDGLRDAAAALAGELARSDPDPAALSSCRWTLTRLLTQHLAYEDTHLYAELPHRGSAAAAMAARMREQHGDLSAAYHAHVREWTVGSISDDWPGFRRAASALLATLGARMEQEERDLYPLLLVNPA